MVRIRREPKELGGLVVFGLMTWTSIAWGQEERVEGEQSPLPDYDSLLADILSIDIGAIPIWRIAAASLILMAGIMMRTTLLSKIVRPVEILAGRTKTEVDDQFLEAVKRPMGWLTNLVAIYFAVLMLQVPPTLHVTTVLILQTMGTVFVAWMIFNVVDALGAYLSEVAQKTESQIDDHLVPLVKRVLRIILVTVAVISIIQQWGYDVTSLIAGLGIGGLAFALAAQSTLSNWFGSVMILTDRPFSVGDLIRSDHGEGKVVDIGLRSTRIQTFEGTMITVPNSDIATTPVENINAREWMNLRTEIGLMYSTPRPTIEKIVERIRAMLQADESVRSDEVLVCFQGFGPSSLDVLIHCFVRCDNWWDWNVIRGRLLFEVMTIVEEEGSGFAFPSQSLYFENALEVGGNLNADKVVSVDRHRASVGAGDQ